MPRYIILLKTLLNMYKQVVNLKLIMIGTYAGLHKQSLNI